MNRYKNIKALQVIGAMQFDGLVQACSNALENQHVGMICFTVQ